MLLSKLFFFSFKSSLYRTELSCLILEVFHFSKIVFFYLTGVIIHQSKQNKQEFVLKCVT